MNKSKVMSTLMAGAMLVSSALPVVAADSSQSCTVKYSQSSSYSVNVPKEVSLKADKTGTYSVTVTGEIAANKKVVVAPDSSFTMTSAAGETVTATVTQETDWSATDVAASKAKTGTISATKLTVGDWTGTFTFTISLEDK